MSIQDCQIQGIPRMTEGSESATPQTLTARIKLLLKRYIPHTTKRQIKRLISTWLPSLAKNGKRSVGLAQNTNNAGCVKLQVGDWVRIRSYEEIAATTDRWGELRGCSFLAEMRTYCGTMQRVFKRVERVIDERDYKAKRCRGIVLLDGLICLGTETYGHCDRSCLYFWREEWLEKIV